MTRAQTWIRLFGAAMLLFAVALLPSAVLAHTGHRHGATASAAAPAQRHDAAREAAAAAGVASDDVGQAHHRAAAVGAAVPAGNGDSGCITGCCAMGPGCCPGVATAAADSLPALPPLAGLRPPEDGGRDLSADPESLPKPPKVLA